MKPDQLRCRAEEVLSLQPEDLQKISQQDLKIIIHELAVHQIELEMQNDELRRAQEEMEASQKKYSDLYHFAPLGYCTLNKEGVIQEINKTGLDLLGEKRTMVIGKPIYKFVARNDKDTLYIHLRHVFGSLSKKTCDLRLKQKEGEEMIVRLESLPVEDEKGNFTLCRTAFSDISEEKRAEKTLADSEAKYAALVEHSLEVIIILQDWVVKFSNKAAEELGGYRGEEMLGESFLRFVAPEERESQSQRYAALLRGEEELSFFETKILAKDGAIKEVEVSARVIHYEDRPAVMAMLRDISARKQTEREKEILHAQLLQSQKMEAIGLLAAGVAHDFNNLLLAIQGYLSMTMLDVDENDPSYFNLRQIRQAADQAANLTRQLLIFSRRQATQLVPVNINQTIENLLKILHRLIGEDITLTFKSALDLCPVLADEGNIEQVIMNLAVNARDAMPRGGKLTIKTELIVLDERTAQVFPQGRPGRFVRLSMTDTGCGMSPEILPRIFEPFFSTKETGKGTGLGLSVVYGIINQHHGWIKVASEPGQGTTFDLYLPAYSGQAEGKKRQLASLSHLQGKGQMVLAVEDDLVICQLLETVLVKNGYQVICGHSAQEALDLFFKEAAGVELVLTDMILPEQTGLELIDRLRQDKPKLKVLLMSGYTDEKSEREVIEARGLPFLHKPFTPLDLLQKIHTILEEV